ncbi:hypothetical protein [Microbulbifer variabilis]|uniref:hypothetical protein n=1 Tax=Microbulbifer variabilis TaxID=266805 RepID=UPI0012F921C9|nr:hypothetical protein [Microbulbifer variabilis]
MNKFFSILLLLIFSSSAFADRAWYRGTINRIWTLGSDGSFIITVKEDSVLSDCKWKYAYFTLTEQTPEKLRNSLSLALSAFHAGTTVGLEIDKDLHGDLCQAYSIDLIK